VLSLLSGTLSALGLLNIVTNRRPNVRLAWAVAHFIASAPRHDSAGEHMEIRTGSLFLPALQDNGPNRAFGEIDLSRQGAPVMA